MRTASSQFVLLLLILVVLGGCKFSKLTGSGWEFTVKISTDEANKDAIIEKAIKSLERKIDAIHLDGEVTRVEGSQDAITVKIFGKSPTEPEKKTLFENYQLELRKVVTRGQYSFPTQEEAQANVKADQEVLPGIRIGEQAPREFFLVEKQPVITGEDIRSASATTSSGSDYSIAFNLKPESAEKFGFWTEANIGNYLAIVLNKEVQSAPIIKGKITDSGMIDGRFTKASAEDIALSLKSGYLPATMTIIDTKRFGI
jgi:preprotein translocase subunit SecD